VSLRSKPRVADDPAVTVIIPSHQRRAELERALLSLSRQTAPPGSYEVVVAVDDSTDGTGEMLAGFDAPFELHAVESERRGRASACTTCR
jgi:glycosyltransferase involved in cell wall biosynthesis